MADGAPDVVLYLSLADKGDTVNNFMSGEDTIELVASGFVGTVPGDVHFYGDAIPAPVAAEGTLLYDTDDGKLYWDADGTGGGVKQLLLTLSGHPALVAGDILIV